MAPEDDTTEEQADAEDSVESVEDMIDEPEDARGTEQDDAQYEDTFVERAASVVGSNARALGSIVAPYAAAGKERTAEKAGAAKNRAARNASAAKDIASDTRATAGTHITRRRALQAAGAAAAFGAGGAILGDWDEEVGDWVHRTFGGTTVSTRTIEAEPGTVDFEDGALRYNEDVPTVDVSALPTVFAHSESVGRSREYALEVERNALAKTMPQYFAASDEFFDVDQIAINVWSKPEEPTIVNDFLMITRLLEKHGEKRGQNKGKQPQTHNYTILDNQYYDQALGMGLVVPGTDIGSPEQNVSMVNAAQFLNGYSPQEKSEFDFTGPVIVNDELAGEGNKEWLKNAVMSAGIMEPLHGFEGLHFWGNADYEEITDSKQIEEKYEELNLDPESVSGYDLEENPPREVYSSPLMSLYYIVFGYFGLDNWCGDDTPELRLAENEAGETVFIDDIYLNNEEIADCAISEIYQEARDENTGDAAGLSHLPAAEGDLEPYDPRLGYGEEAGAIYHQFDHMSIFQDWGTKDALGGH